MNKEFDSLDEDDIDHLDIDSTMDDEDDEDLPEEEHDDDFEANGIDDALISADDVSLQIKCEVGQITASLAELAKYKVGDILDLVKWPGKVKLSANGTYFAEGVLVEVSGMLGVKITNKISYI
ncbi:MAG: FliM/FliN family flagellar motor switch protein [Burkholderiales bacterium]|nr:FliM/FliN family flagellar motor switch protein [Burkholderiales bacterium]